MGSIGLMVDYGITSHPIFYLISEWSTKNFFSPEAIYVNIITSYNQPYNRYFRESQYQECNRSPDCYKNIGFFRVKPMIEKYRLIILLPTSAL